MHLLFTISPKGQLAHRLNTFLPVSSLEKKFHKLEARAHQLNVNQSETRAKVKEMEDGLNELNKQVDEKLQANCKKTRKTRYKAHEDKY